MKSRPKIDLTGKEYKEFKVVKYIKKSMWECKCNCGKTFFSYTTLITREIKRSCGCKNFSGIVHKNASVNPQEGTFKSILSSYKNTARRRNKSWELKDEEALELFKGDCFYCGVEPITNKNRYITSTGKTVSRNIEYLNKAWVKFNGIDRKNNDLGYTLDNCVSCCQICNFAKHTLGYDEFFYWMKRIAKNIK